MSKKSRRRQRTKRLLRAPVFERFPKLTEHRQCDSCGRWHLRIQACPRCLPKLPDVCVCDWVWWFPPPPPDAHRHYTYEILEAYAQAEYEAADDSILLDASRMPGPEDEYVVIEEVADPMPRVVVTRVRRRPHWREAPDLAPYFEQYPQLRAIAGRGMESIFNWAGFSEVEADVFALDAAGYTEAGIAHELGRKQVWVENMIANAYWKVSDALKRLTQGSVLHQRCGE